MTIRPRSLVVTLTLWYVVILTVLIAAAGFFVYQTFEWRLLNEVDQTVRSISWEVWTDWESKRGYSWAQALDTVAQRHTDIGAILIKVELDKAGSPVPGRTVGSGRQPLTPLLLSRREYAAAVEQSDKPHALTVPPPPGHAAPLRIGLFDMPESAVMQVCVSLEQTEARLRQLGILMAVGGTLLLVFASLGGRFIVQRALRPVQDVVRAARALSAEDLSHRIEGAGREDEIGDLVATFNQMADRLERSVDRIKQFTADVSHELRTPLTIMRGEIEVSLRRERTGEVYRETLESVLGEVEGMGRLIEDLLLLSRLDASKGPALATEVALDDVVLRVFEHREPLARAKGVQFEMSEVAPVVVRGDDGLLERVVSNLIDNAIRHTPAGGRVEIGLAQTADAAVLRVTDTGVGIPSEAIPRLFERFFVADPSRSRETGGAGLGLAIVKSVADLHGASVTVESEVEKGTTFAVTFRTTDEARDDRRRPGWVRGGAARPAHDGNPTQPVYQHKPR